MKNAVNDALDLVAALSGKGFKVILKQNASKTEMRNAIREFGKEINDGGVGLFYYSGHGIQVDSINCLVPVDADVQMKSEGAMPECQWRSWHDGVLKQSDQHHHSGCVQK